MSIIEGVREHFACRENRLKWQALFSVFIAALVLTTFVPRPDKGIKSIAVPISISLNSHDYALLGIPFRVDDNIRSAKRNENGARGKRASAESAVGVFLRYSFFIPSLCPHLDYAGNFDSVFGRDFGQTCLLIDLPPPYNRVS